MTHAILNRVKAGGYGDGISGVVMAPAAGVNPRLGYHEFSPWNTGHATEGQPAIATLDRDRPADYQRIGSIVDKSYYGIIPDPTGGATHYYGLMRGHPSWSPPLAAQSGTASVSFEVMACPLYFQLNLTNAVGSVRATFLQVGEHSHSNISKGPFAPPHLAAQLEPGTNIGAMGV